MSNSKCSLYSIKWQETMTEVIEMLERTQLKIDESEKIMELSATTLQTISKGTQQKDGEKPNNKKG